MTPLMNDLAARSRISAIFMLVALYMLPTGLSSWYLAGNQTWINAATEYPMLISIGFLVGSLFCIIMANISKSLVVGVLYVLLLTLLIGPLIAVNLHHFLQTPNGPMVICFAVAGTVLLTVLLSLFAMLTTIDTGFLKWYLFAGLLMIIIMSALNVLFFKLSIMETFLSIVSVFLFSAYVVFDVQEGARNRTSIVQASLDVYLDMLNLFVNLLSLLGGSSDD